MLESKVMPLEEAEKEQCPNYACYSFMWPGQGRSNICLAHAAWLLEVAGALGMGAEALDFQPTVKAVLTEIPRCNQVVAKSEDL